MCKVLIVEPHGDDALCSCSSILRNPYLDISVVTLGDSRSSADLQKFYPSVTFTTYTKLPDVDYSYRPKEVTTHDVHKRFLSGEDVHEYYKSMTINGTPPGIYRESSEYLIHYVSEWLQRMVETQRYVLIPVGLVHPYHILVNQVLTLSLAHNNIIFYGDKPYLGNRYARECFMSFKNQHALKGMSADYPDREDTVKTVLSKVYPTEVNMLRFSSQALLHDPDLFLSNDLTFKEVLFNETVVCDAI